MTFIERKLILQLLLHSTYTLHYRASLVFSITQHARNRVRYGTSDLATGALAGCDDPLPCCDNTAILPTIYSMLSVNNYVIHNCIVVTCVMITRCVDMTSRQKLDYATLI